MAAVPEAKLHELLLEALKHCAVNTTHLKVCRKTKDLANGDFIVPKGVLHIDLDSEAIKAIHLEAAIQQDTAQDSLPISSISHDAYNSIVFHVDRTKAYRNIIHNVLSAGDKYGFQPQKKDIHVIVNPVDVSSCAGYESLQSSSSSLTQLRAAILLKHLLQLFTANGYEAQIANMPITKDVQDLLDVLHVDSSSVCQRDMIDKVCQQLLLQAQSCCFRESVQPRRTLSDTDHQEEEESVVLNARMFLEHNSLPVGRNGYDKNLNLINVRLEDGSLSDVVRESAVIENVILGLDSSGAQENCKSGEESSAVFVHLVSQGLAFSQQQAELVWRMCVPALKSQCFKQQHLVFGTVGGRKSAAAVMDAKEFYNVRHRQMMQAAMMKYGDHDQGAAWDDMISGLTAASITFDILTTASPSQVHLDLTDDEGDGAVDNRSGPFVLYNCARLASLFDTFQQQVDKGFYPPLPDLADVDFRLLREEEEWTIALLYIDGYSRLVHETFHNWCLGPSITANIHTHKISHFMVNFSKTLSSYYSRYHILGGPEEHLLPRMFARLSLMKAAHQVLCNGLQLLGLQPFAQL